MCNTYQNQENKHNPIPAGCDEVGRGAMAGAVVAAAVILPEGFTHDLIRDSKRLNEKQRYEAQTIIHKHALDYAVGYCTSGEIEQINILQASILAMHRAIRKLRIRPARLLVDGRHFKPIHDIPYECIVRGDTKVSSISAASILAKVWRDRYMQSISHKYEHYKWSSNKGYPSLAHRQAIEQYGYSPYHRMTFKLKKKTPKED